MYLIAGGIVEILSPENPAAGNCRDVQRPRSANDAKSPAEFCFMGPQSGNRSGHRGHDGAGRQQRQRMKAVAKQASGETIHN